MLKAKNSLLEKTIIQLKGTKEELTNRIVELNEKLETRRELNDFVTPPKENTKAVRSPLICQTEPDVVFKSEFSLAELNFDEDEVTTKKIETPRANLASRFDRSTFSDTVNNEYRQNCTLVPSKNEDMYRDFFLLTFQSMKINCNDCKPYNKLSSLQMYEEIVEQNIPFHKVDK